MSSVSCWPYVTYLPCLKFGQVLLYPNIIAMESTLVSMEVANASLNNKIFPLYQLSSCWLISQQPTNDSNDSLDLILLIRAFCAFKTKRLTEKKILADTGYACHKRQLKTRYVIPIELIIWTVSKTLLNVCILQQTFYSVKPGFFIKSKIIS